MTALLPGLKAPDFTLPATGDSPASLSNFQGRPVILVFYPADWSPTCGSQLALYNELMPEFDRHRAQLLAISVDGPWCHRAFSQQNGFHFALLSDFEPKGEIARRYGVYHEQRGQAERALFVIDEEGIIRWSYVAPKSVNPGADGILDALEKLEKRV